MGRNKELKSIIIKTLIIALVFLLISTFAVNMIAEKINKDIIERDFAMVGKLIERYPDSEVEIISNITKGASREEIDRAKEVLERYGYNKDIRQNAQPLLNRNKDSIRTLFLSSIALLTLIFLILVYLEYEKIYIKVQNLSSVSQKVMEGDFSVYLPEADEGDFNILNHHFNQMSGRLENSLDILKSEKIYLKDTISNISHQLKTPLSSLIVLNDILIADPDMEESLRLDFLEKMDSQLTRMEWLILNLLKLARIEAGAIDFKREEVLLKDIVDLSIETLKPLLKDVEIRIDGDLNSKFIGDRDWTVEAVINIIKNGVEHGNGKLQIVIDESPLFTSIIIRDNGKGIDNKDLPNIFKRFFKGSSSIKPDSIGIGLNLAKLIVEAQDGTISVRTQKEMGTEFIIRFLKNRLDKDEIKL